MNTLAAWLHTLDPFLVKFTGEFGIRWYGAAYLAGFVLAYVQMRLLASRGSIRIPPDRVGDAMMWLVGGVLVGGRLGYVAFYQPSLLWSVMDHVPFWGVLAINEGGMASHGGMIGVLVAGWRIGRGWRSPEGATIGRCSTMHVLDAVTLVAPAGLCLGRVANFVNGELLGCIVAPPGVPGPWWSVQFPQELLSDQAPALSDQQSSALDALTHQAAPLGSMTDGLAVVIADASHFAEQLRPLLASRHPSQLYQAIAEGPVLAAVLWLVWRAGTQRRPGVVAAAFLIAYGILRILTEAWRLPDAHVDLVFGVSRGRALSGLMVAAGIVLLLPGLMRPRQPEESKS